MTTTASPPRIAIDAMGGDHAPHEIARGAVLALQADPALRILLVGDRERVLAALPGGAPPRLEVVHASQVIGMDEGSQAVRRKRDASVVVAMDLVKRGEADGVVAAGSTGAAMSAALLGLGRLPGVDRPAIAVVLPTVAGPCVLIDAGANVDTKPAYLHQFALMGATYARRALRIEAPRVGLLNIGEEPGKGDERSIEAHGLLSATPDLRFVGNVEGRDLARSAADVVVCDGFVGNVVLKTAEGMGELFTTMLREEVGRGGPIAQLGAALLRPTFRRFRRRLDYAEYGGALLLGCQGLCVIAHGSSKAPAIANAVRVATQGVSSGVVQAMAEGFAGAAA